MKTLNNINVVTLAILTGVAGLTLTSTSFAARHDSRQSFGRQVQSYDAPVIYCQTASLSNCSNRSYSDHRDEKRWVKAVRILANAIIEAHRKPSQTIVYTQPLPQQTVIINKPCRTEVVYVQDRGRNPKNWNDKVVDKHVTIVNKKNKTVKYVTTMKKVTKNNGRRR